MRSQGVNPGQEFFKNHMHIYIYGGDGRRPLPTHSLPREERELTKPKKSHEPQKPQKIQKPPEYFRSTPQYFRLTKNNLKKSNQLTPCISTETVCPHCFQVFTHRKNLYRHLRSRCPSLKDEKQTVMIDDYHQMRHEMMQMKEEMEHMKQIQKEMKEKKQQPINITNNLNIMCIGSNDNYLDMLTEQVGFEQALEYVKGCALSDITGDVRLIEKIYYADRKDIDNDQPPIEFLDRKRFKLSFYDENKKKIIDMGGDHLSQRLTNNLQNTYLKGVNYLINRTLEERRCPNQFLEEYDIQLWNRHIYELSDWSRQKQLLRQLQKNH